MPDPCASEPRCCCCCATFACVFLTRSSEWDCPRRCILTVLPSQDHSFRLSHHPDFTPLVSFATLCRYMRGECLNHKYVFGSVLPVGRLMSTLADKMQECTQSYVRRPYGVGMLVAGADKTGAHLYQTCPSGNVYEFTAHAIGARAQSARTYLEKFQTAFEPLAAANDRQSLLLHALRALASCTEAEEELSADNASLGVATLDGSFEMIDGAAMAPIIAELASFAPEPPAGAAASAASSSSSSSGAAGSAGGADVDGAGDDEDEDDDMAMA